MLSNNFISKWKVDLGGTSSRILSKNADPSLNPPGFSSGCLSVQQVIYTRLCMYVGGKVEPQEKLIFPRKS